MRIERFFRATLIALVTFLLGSGMYYLTGLETELGLDTLFQIRGPRPAPAEAVVVAMDEASETRLGVWQDLIRWRGFHAKLIQELQRQGVTLIVFDLQFIESHPEQDPAFAAAMQTTGNVLVTACVQKQSSALDECSASNKEPSVHVENGQEDPFSEQHVDMSINPPTPLLAQAVLDYAPFFLPNDAKNPTIREVWIYVDALAETPTLPVLTWFYYLQRTGSLRSVAQSDFPLSVWLTKQRRLCLLDINKPLKSLPEKSDLAHRIDELICQEESRYLDFYGPPKTLRMESYSDVYDGKVTNLAGKVVFVGKANRKYLPSQKDYFQTPFSDTSSGRMAGVEIMATQFANLLENRFITSPLPPVLFLIMFGLVVSLVLTQFAGAPGIGVSILISSVYAGFAAWCFSRSGMWLPVAVPILIQLPITWLISLLWSRRDLLKERKRILAFVRRVFPQWIPLIPASPGQMFPEKEIAQLASQRDVGGVCLATDIEGYTAVAAHHTAHEMWELLNAYYQVLGHPVSSHDGIIPDVTGDSMIAVWIDLPVANQRFAACLAALEMGLSVEQFNKTSSTGLLPTRIGLHEGEMTLGRLVAGESSHYRAIGDTVSTASRIQGVNKFLGTKILASATIAAGLTKVIYRPVGRFRLVGRDEPLELMEIVGKETDIDPTKYLLYEQFASGLHAFRQGFWEDAVVSFQTLLDQHGNDGPTIFYLNLALTYRENPPQGWEGLVTLNAK